MDNLNLLTKNEFRIVITDSGLGGLSVQALMDKKLRINGNKKFELIYFNSFAGGNLGYNSLKNNNDKLIVFDSALQGMMKFNPDMILIACNTLSVLYDQTVAAKQIKIPVIGIVESGIEMLLSKTNIVSDFNVIVIGTETTINSNIHKAKLIEFGIDENKIINQSCENLESEIQINPNSTEVNILVKKYLHEAIKKIRDPKKHFFVVLACTHYVYSKNVFEEKMSELVGKNYTIINPNEKMADIFNGIIANSNSRENFVTNRVLSRVKLKEDQINILSKLLINDSRNLVDALIRNEHIPNLFTFDEKLLSIEQ